MSVQSGSSMHAVRWTKTIFKSLRHDVWRLENARAEQQHQCGLMRDCDLWKKAC